MALKIVTEPAAEPVTTVEAKSHLRVDISTDDTLIGSLILAARQMAEQITRRGRFWRNTYASCLSDK